MDEVWPALCEIVPRYDRARAAPFHGHPIKLAFQGALPRGLRACLGPRARGLRVRGSAGARGWAAVPWLGVFDPEVTVSARRGLYAVVLVDAAGGRVTTGVTIGAQWATDRLPPAQAKEALRRRAGVVRAVLADHADALPDPPPAFGLPGLLPRGYEAAQVLARTLPAAPERAPDFEGAIRAAVDALRAGTARLGPEARAGR